MRDLTQITSILVLLSLHTAIIHAQTEYHYLQPDFDSYAGYLHRISDDSVRLIGIGQNQILFGGARIYETILNAEGDAGVPRALQGFGREYAAAYGSHSLYDGSFIVYGLLIGCDYGVPPSLAYYNRNGDLLWINEINDGYDPPVISLVRDSVIACFTGSTLHHFDLEGNYLESREDIPYSNQMNLRHGFIVTRDNKMSVLDAHFTTLDSTELPSTIYSFDTISGGGYVVVSDSIYILDRYLNKVSSRHQEGFYHDILSTSNGFWLFPGGKSITHLTNDLQKDTIYNLDFNATIGDVIHLGDTIIIAGTHYSNNNPGIFSIRTTATDFLRDLAPDVALMDILFQDTVRYSRFNFGGPFYYYNIDYGRIYVELKNAGTIPVNSTFLKFDQLYCPSFCEGHIQLLWHVDDLDLMPGESTTVILDELYLTCASFSPYDFCLWVAGPDRKPDANASNDHLCVEIDVITDLEHPPIRENNAIDMTISPNPATTELIVGIEAPDSQLHSPVELAVLNSQGQLCLRTILHPGSNIVPLDKLAPGMYFFVVEGNSQHLATRKVIVLPN